MKKRIIVGLDELSSVVMYLKSLLNVCNVFTFTGSLGAGKTTVVRALLKQCGVAGVITSPTFTYLNAYKINRERMFYHFDCYRLESLKDFVAAGFDEYLYEEDSWSFIEWPEIVLPLLKDKVCHITIEHRGLDKREFIIEVKE
ncbi:tRNA (adenosine(37)-N6)-threonylcarbamoyltransferase complex ATPase subunit type 1 TsaE [bacterium]|nr:tRNA (adenosine(37)-N6)-threonylcarbamoyltransferase complex ATPase subunit type 1 TsaE [bacterium]